MNRELAEHGRELQRRTAAVVERFTERARREIDAPSVFRMRRIDLEDHSGTVVAELANALTAIREADDSRLVGDGARIRLLLAELHARQRKSHGWSDKHLRQEYSILREEIHAVLGLRPPGEEDCETARVLRDLLNEMERIGISNS